LKAEPQNTGKKDSDQVPLRISLRRMVSLSGSFAFQIGFHRGLVHFDGSLDDFRELFGAVLEIAGISTTYPLRAEDSSFQTSAFMVMRSTGLEARSQRRSAAAWPPASRQDGP
jgi:hypothetical protein